MSEITPYQVVNQSSRRIDVLFRDDKEDVVLWRWEGSSHGWQSATIRGFDLNFEPAPPPLITEDVVMRRWSSPDAWYPNGGWTTSAMPHDWGLGSITVHPDHTWSENDG